MTIYEPEDFYKIWDPRWIKFNRSVNKLRRMRRKIAHDFDKSRKEGIPTYLELECWFNKQ